ncbi:MULTISPECIES: type IV pilus secretin PilQ [Legionella]|uniref:Type IV pilus secretin PilQ n=1 Tax=Legionella septentrionalis TaxID=2498109 RepID=A0A3S0VBA0_9GAMM|nr:MULTISPECIES: type IV pilus secretin PilQ family protein [Legionella]MCP0914489.1 type IV pilus secretin PilQ [Legionella sp. 27cVA30]RUQ89450.1 type IV pilus secretin PilQ [Legionella septentrionalis]RUQ95594.1 type IV pilus secretin PilQ [Legionella septentrionalis]RUR10463.1 type IV pilus secretin PilQ [Legionella septentrionalis]RUR16083.1 type IV pilus secretin PilQ [Legionella septentrionalis]
MHKIITVFLLWIISCVVFAEENTLAAVKVRPMPDNRVRIDFCFTKPLMQLPASFITQKPPRLVLDFMNSNSQLNENDKNKQIDIGSLVRYKIVGVGNRVRAILDLSDSITYSGQIAGNRYSLMLKGKGQQLISQRKEVFVTNRPVNARFGITNLDFRGIEKQGGRLIVDVTDTGIPIEVTQAGKDVVVNFISTRLPQNLMKRFDVADFHSPTQMISAEQDGRNVRVTLINSGDYGHFAYQVNKQFIVDVFPLSEEEIQQEKLRKKVFTGKRISLNFQDISIRAVLQLLADFTGTNIVVSDEVKGNITLRLNDLPWDQALDIIMTTQGLDKRQVGNVILIDTIDSFDKREKAELTAQQAAKKLAPIRSELLQINYAKAADIAIMLKDKDNSLLSERGTLSVDTRTNTIWLQDTATQIDEIRELVKQLDVPVKQVVIEARIVNMTKDCAEDLGVRFGVSRPTHLSGTLEGANELARGTPPADVPIPDRLNVDLGALPIDATPASIGIALAKLGDNVLLDLELSALESEGKAEIIASPRLMTTNQQAAVIESGEDIPYQESTSSGATAVAFKKAVLSLKVTPQITPDGKLLMDLQINQDSDSGRRVQGVPIILTKSIETNVLVNNGQTIVLGGIYRQDKNNTITRVPFLGELPVVGNLFRRTSARVRNEELLIFITPRIITNNLSITTVEGTRPRFAPMMPPRPQPIAPPVRPWKE